MFIVHGTINSDSKHFILWGESDTSSTHKTRRRSKITPQPFVIAADQIEDWVINLVPHAHPEQQSLQLWLPTHDTQPQASPELRAMGVLSDNDALPSKLHLWKVEGTTLTIPDTLGFVIGTLTSNADWAKSVFLAGSRLGSPSISRPVAGDTCARK